MFQLASFLVRFRDGEQLVMNDIITFDDKQIAELQSVAFRYTKFEIRKIEKYGVDLSYLNEQQKQVIINTKNCIVQGKSNSELLDDDIVQVSLHSVERSLKRLHSNSQAQIINLVEKLKEVDVVLKGQFKGYPSLSYTTMKQGDSDSFKLPISFVRNKQSAQAIKIITVIPKVEAEDMEVSIAEMGPAIAKMLEEMKKRLNEN